MKQKGVWIQVDSYDNKEEDQSDASAQDSASNSQLKGFQNRGLCRH
jgi:hypothetical protein